MRPESPRETFICDAAARLDVSECAVLDLAHRWWFGRAPSSETFERVISAYLRRGEVPPWARHFAREVLRAEAITEDVAGRLGLARVSEAQAPRHGRLIVAATMAVFLVFFVLILNTPYHPETSAPEWPAQSRLSCGGGGPGLAFIEDLAFAISGREAPAC